MLVEQGCFLHMKRQHILNISLSLAINILLSWTLLPFVIPPFEGYSLSKFLEVLFWQAISAIGWPFALLGIILSLPFGAELSSTSALFILMYPIIQILLISSIVSKKPRRMELILLHLFVTLSFAVVWYYVLNGYNFMLG
jgi:hypothetical protein